MLEIKLWRCFLISARHFIWDPIVTLLDLGVQKITILVSIITGNNMLNSRIYLRRRLFISICHNYGKVAMGFPGLNSGPLMCLFYMWDCLKWCAREDVVRVSMQRRQRHNFSNSKQGTELKSESILPHVKPT